MSNLTQEIRQLASTSPPPRRNYTLRLQPAIIQRVDRLMGNERSKAKRVMRCEFVEKVLLAGLEKYEK